MGLPMEITLSIILVTSLLGLVNSGNVEILDDDLNRSADSVARSVCSQEKNPSKQISKLSTLDKLIEYISTLPMDHELAICSDHFLKPLKMVLSLSKSDVCSPEHLSSLELYHYTFVESQSGVEVPKTPKQIRNLFLHYTAKVTEACAERSLNYFGSSEFQRHLNLGQESEKSKAPEGSEESGESEESEEVVDEKPRAPDEGETTDPSDSGETTEPTTQASEPSEIPLDTSAACPRNPEVSLIDIDRMMQNIASLLGGYGAKINYEDMYLFWNLMDNLPKRYQDKFSRYFSSPPARLTVKMKSTKPFLQLRSICLNKLKPVYSATLTPVLRLIDMGYYPKSPALLELIRGQAAVRRLYGLSSLCELLLPVYAIEKESNEAAIVVVQSSEARFPSRDYFSPTAGQFEETELEAVSFAEVDQIETLTRNRASAITKRIRQDIKGRRGMFKKLLKSVVAEIRRRKKTGINLPLKFFSEPVGKELKESLAELDQRIIINQETPRQLVKEKPGILERIYLKVKWAFTMAMYVLISTMLTVVFSPAIFAMSCVTTFSGSFYGLIKRFG